jgi:hypothetical protein
LGKGERRREEQQGLKERAELRGRKLKTRVDIYDKMRMKMGFPKRGVFLRCY